MSRRNQNTCCLLKDLLVEKKNKISLFHSGELRTDLSNAVQAVFYYEAVRSADKRKTQETLTKRLIKMTEDDETEKEFSLWSW